MEDGKTYVNEYESHAGIRLHPPYVGQPYYLLEYYQEFPDLHKGSRSLQIILPKFDGQVLWGKLVARLDEEGVLPPDLAAISEFHEHVLSGIPPGTPPPDTAP